MRIMRDEDVLGVQRLPTEGERHIIENYQGLYQAVFGCLPWGLHYVEGLPDGGPVYLFRPEERGAPRQ